MAIDLNGKTLDEAARKAKDNKFKIKNATLSVKGESDKSTRTNLHVELPNKETKVAVVIGLNPASAGEGKSDNTMSKLSKILYGLGFGKLLMLNLYTFRTESPKKLESKLRALQKDGREEEIQTDFSNFEEDLTNSDAIFIVCGKTVLGDSLSEPGKKMYTEAIRNMLKAIEPFEGKTLHVKNTEGRNGKAWWTTHPRVWGYNSNNIIERFPFSWYCKFNFTDDFAKLFSQSP